MKSLFWKYLSMTMVLLLVSFGLFGVCFLWQSYNYTIGQLRDMLEEDAQNMADLTTTLVENDNVVVRSMFWLGISAIIQNSNETVIVCDISGSVIYYADQNGLTGGNSESLTDTSVPMDILSAAVNNGKYEGISNMGGIYDTMTYNCGLPLTSQYGYNIGAVFVSAPAQSAQYMLDYFQRIFLLIGALVLVMGIVVSYFMARNMSRPLRAMSKAARSFALGDFDVQVPEDRNDEIGELAHSFNYMSKSLAKLEKLRSSFIANVSHELKTPMTTIAGFADGILDGTIPPEKEKQYLQIISNDTKRLSRLVISMLEASRLQSGQIEMHQMRFDLCENVRRVLLGLEQRIVDKKLNVDVYFQEDDMYVTADQDYITQVIYNLTDNACKYSEEGGVMRTSITSEGSDVRYTIANSGPEIPPEMIPYIFDRFYKADQSRGMDSNSAGLGLFIVKTVLNMHGRDIEVTSENGVTTFTFTLSGA